MDMDVWKPCCIGVSQQNKREIVHTQTFKQKLSSSRAQSIACLTAASGAAFESQPGHITSVEINHGHFYYHSPVPLIQEGQLSVAGESISLRKQAYSNTIENFTSKN